MVIIAEVRKNEYGEAYRMDTDGERRSKTIEGEMMVRAYLFSQWQCGNCGSPFTDEWEAEECCSHMEVRTWVGSGAYLFSQWQCGNCGSPFTDEWEAEECCLHMEVVK